MSVGNPIERLNDGENNAVSYDFGYPISGDLVDAVSILRKRHGDDIYLLPISAASCGSGMLQNPAVPGKLVVALKLNPPTTPRVRIASKPELLQLALDEIVIDPERRQLCTGASITLEQLNQALACELGPRFKVPGADLTSYQYAATGATFMTGGMGPQRRYFSDSVIAASIYDGDRLLKIDGDELSGYAGTYGWTGVVTALCCRYYQFPSNEFAFALPISNQPRQLARLLARLAPYCYLEFDRNNVASKLDQDTVIIGIEHVSIGSMKPLLQTNSVSPITSRALDLQRKCCDAQADGLIFVSGISNLAIDDFLMQLVDDTQASQLTIGAIGLDYAEVFRDPAQMRDLREAIPYAARMQQPSGRLLYKNHSDANIKIALTDVAEVSERLWQINCDYIDKVERYFAEQSSINGEILVYGHLNPFGMDPHNRVTMASDDMATFEQGRQFLIEQRAKFYQDLAQLCKSEVAEFTGSEKTAASEIAIYQALGGAENSPRALYDRFRKQQRKIRMSSEVFNWRAPPVFRE